ncbi:hypothetical protein CHU94_06645 [Rhodoferax sp. TH121]|uniref:hypothetical protein n=1 Tax=Rhodoferax sp. TH121 TaxID=2022803 RepID=UPI000B95EED6|nr:hypothetical protein [Rhodoferax sp. TH121]OYQ40811.1 hypothetical protein CHU94_06645 [Rhodoferax sp. TH121]
MVAITATNSASPSLQATLSKARIEQARREADSAEARASDLRAQADDAEREAQDKNQTARSLSAAGQAKDSTYTSAFRRPSSEVPPATQNFLERMYTTASPKFAASGNPLKQDGDTPPVLNSQGQSTGRILDVRA